MREYLAEGREKLLAARGAGGTSEKTLFVSKNGRPLQPLGLIYPLKKYARAAGINRNVTPHSLSEVYA